MTQSTPTFSNQMADAYHRYLVPLIFDDYASYMARRVAPVAGRRVLEIACGTGALTMHLRDCLDDRCRLVATDINPDLVEVAMANVGDRREIEFSPADGTALPFPNDSFDAVVCQFGVMFFSDKDRGYQEIARVLKPGGRFIFNVWDTLERNRISGLVRDQVVRLMPDDLEGPDDSPFSYNDISEINGALRRAGFAASDVTVMPRMSRAPSARNVACGFVFGSPLVTKFVEQGKADVALNSVSSALTDAFGCGEVEAPMQAIAFEAELPLAA